MTTDQTAEVAPDEWRHICKDNQIKNLKDTVLTCSECGFSIKGLMNDEALIRRGITKE